MWTCLNRNIDKSCIFFFQALDALENYLKIFNSEGLSLPVLSMKYDELKEEIKGCTASTLQKGQTLINKADSHRYSPHFSCLLRCPIPTSCFRTALVKIVYLQPLKSIKQM